MKLSTMTRKHSLTVCLLAIVLASTLAKSETDRFKLLPRTKASKNAESRNVGSESPVRNSLDTKPTSKAVFIGDDATFHCSGEPGSNARIQWWEAVTSPLKDLRLISEQTLRLNHPNAAKYEIQQVNNDSYTLIILGVQTTDAGQYVCIDGDSGPPCPNMPDDQQGYIGVADLSVLGGPPVCETTISESGVSVEGAYRTAECSVSITGKKPEITWYGPDPFVVQSLVTDSSVWSGIEFTVTDSMAGQKFTMISRFGDRSLPKSNDSDPGWLFTYSTPTLDVLWPPKNMDYKPITNPYFVGESIVCSSSASPPANFTWMNMQTFAVFYTDTFTMTDYLAGQTWTMRCQARNIIDGSMYLANLVVNITVIADTGEILIQRNDIAGANAYAFRRSWAEYKLWFGDPATQYWIGLDRLSRLSQGDCKVRFDFQTTGGTFYYAQYTTFKVGDASTNYTLSIGGYTGNLIDAMAHSNNRKFSTYDVDNDGTTSINCASSYAGGFWYDYCTNVAINSGPSSNFFWYTQSYRLNYSEVRLLC